jgi:hypothetical protein
MGHGLDCYRDIDARRRSSCCGPWRPGADDDHSAGCARSDRVSGLPHEAPTDFETKEPGMGYGVRFPQPDWTIDIYIYDLKMKSIPDDPASAAVQAALEEAKGEIVNTAKRGDYAGLTMKDVFTITDTR